MYNIQLKKMLNEENYNSLINSNFCKSSFSQYGEDLIINKVLGKIKFGNYLDLGSFHPIHFSNTFTLYIRGWRGINIDGNEEMINVSKKVRPLDKNIFAYLSNAEKECFYLKNKKHPAMNKIVDEVENLKDHEEYVKIKTQTLETLISSYDQYLYKLYYLNIDLEFLDDIIIRNFNFSNYKPLLITIEMHNLDLSKDSEISVFLKKHNYSLYSYINPTAFFVENKFKENNFDLL